MSLLPWNKKLSPQLLKILEGGSPKQIQVLIKVIPEVMVSLESVLVKKYNIKVVRRIPSAGYISATVEEDYIPEIAKMPQVISVTHIPATRLLSQLMPILEAQPKLLETVTTNEVSDFLGLTTLKGMGFTGKGVTIALVDSGLDPNHPMLLRRVVAEKYFTGTNPRDDVGHGIHVAGIAVGNRVDTPYGTIEGMAPDAHLVNVKVFSTGDSTADICMQGLEYAAKNAKIVNCSWGSDEHFEPFHDLIRILKQKYGCIFIFAAGNSGSESETIACPADSADVVAVGSVAIKRPKPSEVANFSSRGPALGLIKPDIMGCGGSTEEGIVSSYLNNTYESKKGTSMSTPTISGGLACLYQVNPTPNIVSSLYDKASRTNGKNNTYGWGIPRFSESFTPVVRKRVPTDLLTNLSIIPVGMILAGRL